MRIISNGGYINVHLSAKDTYDWAHRPRAAWPYSDLSGKRCKLEFDSRGNLTDFRIEGGRGSQNVDSTETEVFVADIRQGVMGLVKKIRG
jgi:hypothetical protein